MALQKCNESGCIWSHPPRNEKLTVGSSEDAVLCGAAWLKLLSPKDGSAVKPAILPCWELTGLGERFVVQLRVFFPSVSLTAYRKTCAARVAQEVGGLLKGLGVAFPLWPFGMGLVVFFLPEVLLPCPYFGSVVVADAQHHWHCVSMLVFSLSHFIKQEL